MNSFFEGHTNHLHCLWLAGDLSPSLDIGFFEAGSDGGCCSRHVSDLTLHKESVEERLRLLKSDHFLSLLYNDYADIYDRCYIQCHDSQTLSNMDAFRSIHAAYF